MNIPELTAFQYDSLMLMVNTTPFIAASDILETDEPENRSKLFNNLTELDKLIELGFLKESTDMFGEAIEKSKQKNGRGFKVYGMTEMAVLMFAAANSKVVN